MIASGPDRAPAEGPRAHGRGVRIVPEKRSPAGDSADAPSAARAQSAPASSATPALTVVGGGLGGGGAARMREEFLDRLSRVILETERAGRIALVAEMRAAGVPWEDIADHYIPEAARRLGALWCEDALGFAEVTIGTARLQAMLRDALPDPEARPSVAPFGPAVVVAVRQDDYHTLGAMVAAARLRRAGVTVRLSLGQSDAELARLMAARAHDALFLSASGSGSLDSLRELVETLRAATDGAVPIVLGGSILLTGRDLQARTGVDHAVPDPIEALRLCGLSLPKRVAATAEIGS